MRLGSLKTLLDLHQLYLQYIPLYSHWRLYIYIYHEIRYPDIFQYIIYKYTLW
jgi:hypothetical protein